MDRCLYCQADLNHGDEVPAVGDDAAWAELALEHAPKCEWIQTRAHRRELPVPTIEEIVAERPADGEISNLCR